MIDLRVSQEVAVAAKLADFTRFPHRSLIAAIDSQRHEVVLVKSANGIPVPLNRHPVASMPVSVQRIDNERFSVASLWAKQISVWKLSGNTEPADCKRIQNIDLPFAPRLQCLTPNGKYLLVSDSFGPYLAIIDLSQPALRGVVKIPGHNIRGLTISSDGDHLLVAHQLINEFVPTTRDHIFWGTVVSNLLRTLPLSRLLAFEGTSGNRLHGSLFPIGREGHGAGDPGEILVTADGDVIVALNGTGQLALRRAHELEFKRVNLGQGPFKLSFSPGKKFVYAASQFDDQISKIRLKPFERVTTTSLGPTPALAPSEVGEMRFYDSTLSLDGWLSCHSCHPDGHSSDFVNDNFGDDTIGAPKRIPSLLGTGVTAPWSWRGSEQSLSAQIRKSLYQTMRAGDKQPLREDDVLAITDFVQNLRPADSISAARRRINLAAERRGKQLFVEKQCDRCHRPPTYTSPETYSVGIRDELGVDQFNPPTLLGVSQRRQLLHDGRATSLRELFALHHHPHDTAWTEKQISDLVAFLESL
ncbi:MAG: cytochrome c peroxidase [Pirellulaceae bacterium]|nr:cytochrome c peroxidase [Pirellulaceae bacterium]